MHDPTSKAFWADTTLSIKYQIALNTRTEVTSTDPDDRTLAKMRQLHTDEFDVEVGKFVGAVDELEEVYGDRVEDIAEHELHLGKRSQAVKALSRFLVFTQGTAAELAARTDPDQAEVADIGGMLVHMMRQAHVGPDMPFREAVLLARPVVRFLDRHAAKLDGKGFSAETRAFGKQKLEEATGRSHDARDRRRAQESTTVDVTAAMGRVVDFFTTWAKWRNNLQGIVDFELTGFDLAEAYQWQATRPAELAARAAEARAATAPVAAPTGVVADAMAMLRAPVT